MNRDRRCGTVPHLYLTTTRNPAQRNALRLCQAAIVANDLVKSV
jgi:hypothetical protein